MVLLSIKQLLMCTANKSTRLTLQVYIILGVWLSSLSVVGFRLPSLTLTLVKGCGVKGNAVITVKPSLINIHRQTCTILYHEAQVHRQYIKKQYITGLYDMTLTGLKTSTEYLVYATCGSYNSSVYSVTTGVCPPMNIMNNNTTTDRNSPVMYKEENIFSASASDIVLGVVFSVIAIIIVSVTGYYMYHRHQRRRRLQQFLRTPHTDPFESLQSYMEVES